MLVKNWMRHPAIWAGIDDTMDRAIGLLKEPADSRTGGGK